MKGTPVLALSIGLAISMAFVIWKTSADRSRLAVLDAERKICQASHDDLLRALEVQKSEMDRLRDDLAKAENLAREASHARDEAVRRIAALRRARPTAEPDACSAVELPEQTKSWLIDLARGGGHVQ